MDDLESLLKEAEKYKPCAGLYINEDSHRVSLYSDTSKK